MKISTAALTLLAFVERSSRWFAVFIYGLFAGLALVMMLIFAPDRPAGALAASMFFGIGTGIAWVHFAHNGITLMRNARALRMPSTGRAVFSALLLLFAATVVTPAAFLSWYGGGNFLAFVGALACTALVGLLATMLNRAMVVGFILLLSGGTLLLNHLHLEYPISLPHFGEPAFVGMVVMAALFLGALCAVRWVQLQRQERTPFAWIHQSADASKLDGSSHGSAQHAYRRMRVNLKGLGPHCPVSAMGVWLGSPFAPLSWRQRFVSTSIGFGWILVSALFFAFTISKEILLPWLGFMASISFLAPFGPRLRHLFRRRSGEMAELALIPGWGNARQARRILLQAVFQTLGKQFFGLCAAMVLTALVLGTPSAAYLIIAGVAIGVGSISIAFSMRALADMESTSEVVLFLVVMLIAGAMILRSRLGGHLDIDTMLHMDIFWLALSVLMCLLTLHAYRRFVARPHPFLTS